MGSQLHYRGTLEETSLAEMLYTIFRHKVPGRIEITNDGVSKRIYIDDGNVVHAASSDRSDRLGAHLYRIGKLSRKDLVETMRRRETAGKRYGEILIEEQLLSPEQLYGAIRGQMESIVWSVFSWQRGEVSFQIGELEDPIRIKMHIPMRQVILRGIKRAPDPKSLVARLGKKTTVYRGCYHTEDLIEVALNTEEYALLCLVDGRRSLYDVCTEGPYAVSENARLLYAFHILQLIERTGEEATGSLKIRYPSEAKREHA